MEVERALGTLDATHKVPRNPGLPRGVGDGHKPGHLQKMPIGKASGGDGIPVEEKGTTEDEMVAWHH